MIEDYHGERKIILSENYSHTMSSSRCTVKKLEAQMSLYRSP